MRFEIDPLRIKIVLIEPGTIRSNFASISGRKWCNPNDWNKKRNVRSNIWHSC